MNIVTRKNQFHANEAIFLASIPIENVLDVGCHEGGTMLGYQKRCDAKMVYAFEPYIENYNIAKTKIVPGTEIFNVAVSDIDDPNGKLFITASSACNSLEKPVGKLSVKCEQPIRVVRIDTWAAEHNVTNVDFVKIDTQGNDFRVVKGMGELIKKVKALHIEVWFGGDENYYENVDLFEDVVAYMYANGMKIYNFPMLHHDQNERLLWGDVLFVRQGLV
ncbi:MAG TPA: FkbM family methyltransferase [Candidatus Thermoplasmatota archaeon]|nr:FkbM family methyltransferase [Candidatus Thermoplasmatota archaeon]